MYIINPPCIQSTNSKKTKNKKKVYVTTIRFLTHSLSSTKKRQGGEYRDSYLYEGPKEVRVYLDLYVFH